MKPVSSNTTSPFKKIVRFGGEIATFMNILLPFVILADVLMRYVLNISFPWLFELEWQMFGFIFLLGTAQTYLLNKHVRVDLFYNKWGSGKRRTIDIVGNVIFLIPFCLVGVYYSARYAMNSWEIMEGSPDPGGLPFRFIIKSMIPLMFLLLLTQALSNLIDLIRADD